MPEIETTQFHREGDEVVDTTSFSLLSLLGFVASLIGIFSLAYVQSLPFAVVGILLGIVTLLVAKRFHYNWLSRILGFLSIAIGATFSSWGVSTRYLETSSDVARARVIAEQYLKSLSAKQLDQVYYLVGFPLTSDKSSTLGLSSKSELDRAKARLEEDPAHLQIRNSKTVPRWAFVDMDNEYEGTMGHTYRLRYRDESQTIPMEYWIFVRKDGPKFSTQSEVHWFVDNLQFVKKQ